ncbi:hypothetical protein Forpe1208_v005630 [Fusarium oxysporum f. sp. rapae]|uniref:Lysine-specific metallo-endopeptidase domain-containing protein n=1 Tax=Fusarium oxysporum f. sp. rapae TaxID=485398 RepID=A0A8J5TU37_FUSOX|nr:hypothetical protein Forpe1208_v005630 [Fusarium oxysporum f. sp. rapae]
MKFSLALLFSLTTSVIAAKPKLSDAWEIDDSCDGARLDKLEAAHSEIVELLTKVTNDLAHVQQPRPSTRWGRPNWNRISRNLAGLFGLQSGDVIIENGYDPEEQYFRQVLYTYDRMYQALVKGMTVQENGYSGKLRDQDQHSKPLLLCGDTRNWEFFDQNSQDKWRFHPCDNILQLDNEKWPVRDGGEVEEGTDLDRDNFGKQSLVRVMLHEFAHYYGSRMEGNELRALPDQQAVDTNGCLLWKDSSGRRGREPTTAGGEAPILQVVYSLRYCTNISKDQTANEHAGEFMRDGAWVAGTLGSSGPSAATWTAETYAYFAIISYLDKWEWLETGSARPLPREEEA